LQHKNHTTPAKQHYTSMKSSLHSTSSVKLALPLTTSARRSLLLRADTTCLALELDGPALCSHCAHERNSHFGYTRKGKRILCEQPWTADKRDHHFAAKRKSYKDSWEYLEGIGYAPRDIPGYSLEPAAKKKKISSIIEGPPAVPKMYHINTQDKSQMALTNHQCLGKEKMGIMASNSKGLPAASLKHFDDHGKAITPTKLQSFSKETMGIFNAASLGE
jgi:hypothetical protein